MTNEERAGWGRKALAAGAPDQDALSDLEVGVDVIANVLHALNESGVISGRMTVRRVLGTALAHYADEII